MNERLKEIKDRLYREMTNASYSPIINFSVSDVMELIELAEQQEKDWLKTLEQQQEETERYKGAIEQSLREFDNGNRLGGLLTLKEVLEGDPYA